MERLFLALSCIATGWMPLGFGIYLTYREEYIIAAGCFLVSFFGFRQIYDNLKCQERCKEMKIEIGKISNKLEEKDMEISKKNKEIWKLRNYDY